MINTDDYRISPGGKVNLSKRPTRYDGPIERDDAKKRFHKLRKELADWQEKLYAENKRAVLAVFQAMDAGGKDSTTRQVFGLVDPAGCHVTSFKAPTATELDHDYLWRIHKALPSRGQIGVFNRSHYEDVMIVRAKKLMPPDVWKKRYDHLNNFEQMLQDEGTTIVKFYLHISKDYQKERLQRRLDRPEKHWKFNVEDLAERARWDAYQEALEDTLSRCSTKQSPWYVVPAERRWFRNLLVAQVMVERLAAMKPAYPAVDFDPKEIVIR